MNKIEIIKSELERIEYQELIAKENYPGLASVLNKKSSIPNPEPQKVISKPITIIDLWGQVTPLEALEIYKIPALKPDINDAVARGDRVSLEALLAIAACVLSSESVAKITALFGETIPDPNYKEQIPGRSRAEELGIDFVTDADVQAALN